MKALQSFDQRAGSAEKKPINTSSLDLSVPKDPAFTVLGITPENVIRPTTPRGLASSIVAGADPEGDIQAGMAISSAPYLLWAGNNVSLQEYQANYGIRIASRTQFSLATTKGTSDSDESARLALGLALTPFDLGDPRNDTVLLGCFEEDLGGVHADAVKVMNEMAPLIAVLNAKSTATPAETIDAERQLAALEQRVADLENVAKAKAKSCREAARLRNWNASAWSIGVAPTWTSPSGNTSDLAWSGIGVWSTIGYGFEGLPMFEDSAAILANVRYRTKDMVPDPMMEGSFFEQDTFVAAGQVRIAGFSFLDREGGPDLNFLLEGSYVHGARDGGPDEDYFQYTAGVDVRLIDSMYFSVSIGGTDGRKEPANTGFGMAAIKWGFSDESELVQAP